MSRKNLPLLVVVALIGALELLVPTRVPAQEPGQPGAASPDQPPETKQALKALEAEIGRFDALLEKDNDASHQATVRELLAAFKERSGTVHRAYDQGKYDELRFDLNVEYQRLAMWLADPITPPPALKDSTQGAATVYTLAPAASNKGEINAALAAANREIERLAGIGERLPPGIARDAHQLRIAGLRERREEIARSFSAPRWDALVAAMRNEADLLRH